MRTSVAIPLLYWLLILCSCADENSEMIRIEGEAQGTTYHISWISPDGTNYKSSIDSILRKIDSSLSTYLPVSIISRINLNDSTVILDEHFKKVFSKAEEVSEKTGGLFDVTVAPVINAWGFGFSKKENVDSIMIDSLLQLIGYKMVKVEGNRLIKEKKKIMLDFNAIAQGYTVDVLSSFLVQKGLKNFFVELGGEVKAIGEKKGSELWKVGIDKPDENAAEERDLEAIIELKYKALATSGNYRKFYVEGGRKYSHIIDPHTGYPAKHHLLSASVVADDCMTADAYATAFMVMGVEKTKQFIADHADLHLEIYLVYDDNGAWGTYVSDGLKNSIKELN